MPTRQRGGRLSALLCLFLFIGAVACKKERPGGGREPAGGGTTTATEDRRPVIIFLGDSLTAGFGLPEEQAMPALVQKKVDEAGLEYRVVNAGRSGDTTAGGVGRLDWTLRHAPGFAALVIGLGSNDAMRGLDLEKVEANLRRIAARARQQNPDATVFLLEMKTFPNMGRDYGEAYEQLFQRVAGEEGLVLIPFPLEGIAGVAELNQKDGIHPNVRGTEMMADRVWAVMRTHLSRDGVAETADAGAVEHGNGAAPGSDSASAEADHPGTR